MAINVAYNKIDWFDDEFLQYWENKYEFTYEQDILLISKVPDEEFLILVQRLNKPMNEEEKTIINKYLPDYE